MSSSKDTTSRPLRNVIEVGEKENPGPSGSDGSRHVEEILNSGFWNSDSGKSTKSESKDIFIVPEKPIQHSESSLRTSLLTTEQHSGAGIAALNPFAGWRPRRSHEGDPRFDFVPTHQC